MVTKQQQLEWLANNLDKWKSGYDFAVVDKTSDGGFYVRWPSVCSSGITKREWQQERDKMSSKPEWHERGELPPVGCECEYKPDNYWVKCKVLFAGDSLYVLGVKEFEICVRVLDVEFRPLRTEREKAIDSLIEIICAGGELSKDGSAAREIAERIHDAGVLK